MKDCGKLSWKGGEVYIGRVLGDEPIGLEEIAEDTFAVYYGPIMLGLINQKNEFEVLREKRDRTTYCKEKAEEIE